MILSMRLERDNTIDSKKKTSHTQVRRKGRTRKKSADHPDLEKVGRTDVMVQRHRYVANEESVY